MATIFETIQDLGTIITDAVTAGVPDNIPPRSIRKTLIKVTTGQYREVLPIIVPAECCIMGDELRAVNVQPRKATNATLTPAGDYRYTSKAIERIEQVVGNITAGLTITPTTGNTEVQDTAYPYAETPQVIEGVTKQVRGIRKSIDADLGLKLYGELTPAWDMTNVNAGRGRDLFLLNRDFIKAETTAYITENYPTLKYSRTKCKQDIGFILDALAYDLTYGGNWMSVTAAEAYFDGVSQIAPAASEQAATIAAYGFLKALVQTVQRNITVTPLLQTAVTQISGTGGTATESTTIGNLMDDIIDIVTNGTGTVAISYPSLVGVNANILADSTAINNAKAQVAEYTIDFINKNFGSFTYDSGICRRDLEILFEGAQNDTLTGSNYLAIQAGRAYNRQTSAYLVGAQKSQTVGAIRYARDQIVNDLTDTTYIARTRSFFNEVIDIIQKTTASEDALTFPAYNSVQDKIDAKDNLQANRQFIIDDVVQYVENTYNNPPGTFVYDSSKCARDVGYIVDAMCFDIMYGTNIAAVRLAKSYYDLQGNIVIPGEATETIGAYTHLASIAGQIVQEQSVTKQVGNTQTQTTLGSPATVTEANEAAALVTEITNAITAGNPNGISAITEVTSTETGQTATDYALFDSNRDTIIKETLQYVTDTYSDFKFNHAKCSRDLGLIFDAVRYDAMLNTNYASIVTALSYRRAPSNKVIGDQKDATVAANTFALQQMKSVITGEQALTTAQLEDTFEWVNDIVWTASYEGANLQVADPEVYNALYQLEVNKEFIVQEALNEVDNWFKAAVSKTETDGTITIADTSWLQPNMAVKFFNYDDSTLATVEAGINDADTTTYYVKQILSDTTFNVSLSVGGTTVLFNLQQSPFNYDKEKCRRDTGIILDSVGYDLVLGTNYNQVTAGLAYQRANAADVTGAQLVQTTAGINYAKSQVAELYKIRTSTTGLSRANAAFAEVIDILNNGTGAANALTFPAPTGATANTQNAVAQLIANKAFFQAEVLEYINVNYNSVYLSMDQAKCSRDVGYLTDALCYDIMYGGTSASVQAARAYFVGAVSQLGAGEATATAAAYDYLSTIAGYAITENTGWSPLQVGVSQDTAGTAASATEATLAATLLQIIEDVITAGSLSGLPTATYPDVNFAAADLRAAQIQIEKSRENIINRTVRYLDNTYAGIFEIRSTYAYNRTLCARDVREYILGMKWDMMYSRNWNKLYYSPNVAYDTTDLAVNYGGWYKTGLGARYYVNSILGSQEEDFYYLRNGTGLRLQTMDGLQGDLGPANAYGTSRPTAGAYASLDPGWGPKDERVWITARSPYVQNCTTFGYAAVGQKIDGALHDGGNDSIVSNDFTQVISDGIGAWLLNNGRAELVSVFTYYSHIGYLCETGGRARATNGNNSYGTYGSVAEGVDPTEVAVTAIVDNSSQYNATISSVFTDNDQLLRLEFGHAGNDYTEAKINIFGAGTDEVLVADEFRDGAVARIEIGELVAGDAGGSEYTIVSNTAQAGSTTSINLAATDGSLSSAYIGMAVYITGGAAIGQYGYITTYNSGSKLAEVVDRYGNPGWSHVVPGTAIIAPNSSSTYTVEPRIQIAAPSSSAVAATSLVSDTYNNIDFIETAIQYTGVASESNSDGSGATFDVTRNGAKYYVSVNNAGTEFTRLDTVTIKGSNVGGTDTDNDIVVTITTVDAVTGAIVDFDFTGIGRKGYFTALANGSMYTSIDGGATWTANVVTGNHQKLASGLQNDGSTTFKPHAAVATRASSSSVAYINGTEPTGTWSSSTLTGITAGTVMSVAFGYVSAGTNKFVAISNADQDIAYSLDAGQNWTNVAAALPTATGYTCLTYGKGLFVALRGASNGGAISADGENWTAVTLPNTKNWVEVKWGNGIFVAIASDAGANNMAYSIDGTNWTAASTPNAVGTPSGIAYGQGVFMVTYSNDETRFAESYDGVVWFDRTGQTDVGEKVAFGNPHTVGATTPKGRFIAVDDTTNTAKTFFRSAPALGRPSIANNKIFEIRITEPGSGYTSAPAVTVTDPGNIDDVILNPTIKNGTLGNPTFVNRGSSFITASAEVDADTSNGGADFLQSGQYLAVRRLSATPVPGSNIEFSTLPGQFFKLVNTVSLVGTNDGSKTAFLQLSPDMSITDAPVDGTEVEMRIRFSQVRLTGHDFLDIGTGGFTTTNYPGIPLVAPDQTKETKDFNGGRVFFTATDQDGNFRVGDLFSIEQATGVATLNAEAFNIAGLQELTLGEVTLGGNSAAISEFSTDPFFTANSDTVVPTQRAVKAYIEAQIGGGGATLNVNSVTAGDIFINTNQITTVSGEQINIKANVNFTKSVLGLPLAYNYFLR